MSGSTIAPTSTAADKPLSATRNPLWRWSEVDTWFATYEGREAATERLLVPAAINGALQLITTTGTSALKARGRLLRRREVLGRHGCHEGGGGLVMTLVMNWPDGAHIGRTGAGPPRP